MAIKSTNTYGKHFCVHRYRADMHGNYRNAQSMIGILVLLNVNLSAR